MKGKKEDFLQELTSSIVKIRNKRKLVAEIKQYLTENHGILGGEVQTILNDPETELQNLDVRLLYLINEQVYNKTGNLKLESDLHFTSVEKREAKLYEGEIFRHNRTLPITLENVMMVGNGAYGTIISAKDINELLKSQLLHYDPELQREMKVIKKGNQIVYEPTLVQKNVNEITEHMVNKTLVPTTLVWNAMLGSSEDGEELIYDPKTFTMTITEGTKLAIVDGYHRHKASQKAIAINPDIDFNFQLLITNYNKEQAQQYQAQLAEATPITKNRKIQLKGERYADSIVTRLMQESDLKNKVSTNPKIKITADQLVSYNVLSDTIEQSFDITTKRESMKVGDFLVSFFDELLGVYPEQFVTNTKSNRLTSLMNNNNMFVGYVTLAARMYKDGVDINKLEKILNNIDFSYNNKEWKKLGILDENNHITDTVNSRKQIVKYFKELNLREKVKNN